MSHTRYTVAAAVAVVLTIDSVYRTVLALQGKFAIERALLLLGIAFIVVLCCPVRPSSRS